METQLNSALLPLQAGSTFRYSRFLQILFPIGAVFFLSIAVLALQARPENGGGLAWPAIMFLGFGLLNCFLFWAVLATVATDSEGVVATRLGAQRKLFWRDIRRIEHRPTSGSLVISTGTSKLRIHRQLKGFLAFWDILLAKAPAGAVEPAFSLPFQVPASWNMRIVFGGMALFFLSVASYSALSGRDQRTALLMAAFGVGNFVLLAWHAILRVEFESAAIHLVYAARRITIPAIELDGVSLFQRDLDIVLLLHLAGKSRPIEMSDNQFTIAPERVYASVTAAYGLSENSDV
jgi:hypothetical protein